MSLSLPVVVMGMEPRGMTCYNTYSYCSQILNLFGWRALSQSLNLTGSSTAWARPIDYGQLVAASLAIQSRHSEQISEQTVLNVMLLSTESASADTKTWSYTRLCKTKDVHPYSEKSFILCQGRSHVVSMNATQIRATSDKTCVIPFL